MTRTYTLRKRAEQQAGTRRRIVQAAVELHGSIGPAHTTVSMVAEKAGVQRHTFYAHFPDERSLFMACSGLVFKRDPPPDAAPWKDVEPGRQRLRAGLSSIYEWYARNAGLLSSVLRDAEYHALTKETNDLRFGPYLSAYLDVLGADLEAGQRALLRLALSFFTWRTLARDCRLSLSSTVEAMVRAIEAAEEN